MTPVRPATPTPTPETQVKQPQPDAKGPVPLTVLQVKQVSGGSPKGGWPAAPDAESSPRGGW